MAAPSPTARTLLRTTVPAIVIGCAAALLLLALFAMADWLEDLVWNTWPSAMGVPEDAAWWTISMLTLTGMAVGLLVWKLPGHGGPDPATRSLVSPPLPVSVVPSLTLVLIITLAGGPSLGPENPILAIAVALTLAAGRRISPETPAPQWIGLATAGMVGAMFGTPVAAALILTEMFKGSEDDPLWNRLFTPLVAATAGSLTIILVEKPIFSIEVSAYDGPRAIDLVLASLIAVGAAVIGLAGVYAFPVAHRMFHRLRHPLLMLTAGGAVLGLLGALGGRITLFRGIDEMGELADTAGDYSVAGLALIVAVKLVALVVSATSGFPGGRIFPAVFLGVAFGLLIHSAFPDIPEALSIAAGVLGLVMAVSRDGWMSLFLAVIIVGDVELLPIMLLASLPTWLLLVNRPPMLIEPAPPER